jgi:ribosomal-protein-alanine N-acetyltransferase
VNTKDFRVLVAEAEDVSAVLALERDIAEAPHWAEAEYAAIIKVHIAADSPVHRCLLVAKAKGRLVGFAVGKVIGSGMEGLGELESIAVDGSARRMGVGRELCSSVFAWCERQNVTVVELEVRAGSGGAIALYTGLGFVVTGRRTKYYREPVEDAVLMRLDLAKYK